MTKGQIEDRICEILAAPSSLLFRRDGEFVLYAPLGEMKIPCSRVGSTIQQAIFSWEFNRERKLK